MASRLVNVRLDEERLRKARLLRERGLALSDVIREALDQRFEQLNQAKNAREVKNIVELIFQQYPDPAGLPPRSYNVHDRKARRSAIREKLSRRDQ